MHIAKLCSDIQHNAESSIIQIIEKHLSKQKHTKKKNKNKNKKNPHNFKLRFQPIEHPPLHLLTLPQRLKPPLPQNTTHQSLKPQPHSAPIQPSKAQVLNISNQPPRTTLPPIPNPSILHHTKHSSCITTHTGVHHQTITFTLTLQTTAHLPYHVPSQPIHKTLTNTTQPSSISAPQASHTHQQRKFTLINTTQLPQHPSHNTRYKHNQNFNTLQRRHN